MENNCRSESQPVATHDFEQRGAYFVTTAHGNARIPWAETLTPERIHIRTWGEHCRPQVVAPRRAERKHCFGGFQAVARRLGRSLCGHADTPFVANVESWQDGSMLAQSPSHLHAL